MMTNEQIREIALAQSAIDLNCAKEDFLRKENVIVTSAAHPKARRYLELPFACNLVSYGSNVVASVNPRYRELAERYLARFDFVHCFETPNAHALDEAFAPYGLKTCFMAEYFLPDVRLIQPQPCLYETRLLQQTDFQKLYVPAWSNALCEKRKELDVLGVGAYRDGELVALAACSADCDEMWQIGVDVLPRERGQGLASAVTSRLAAEILARDKAPFYCCAWSNIPSARNAIRSGFRPAWVELTVKSEAFVREMNGEREADCT